MKNTIIETAITISLLMMGNWLTLSTMRLALLPRLKMPIDANVPIIVATTEDMLAMINVLAIALQRSGDLSDLKIEMYASKLNPLSKLKFELFEKEYTMSKIIGAYKIARIIKR